MYILAQMVLVNYIPEKFERNMRWKSPNGEVWGLIYTTTPLERLIEEHGYPVKPYIMPISANPDDHVEPLAHPEQIGWWDEGPQSDELRDITNSDITNIMLEEDGIIQIEVSTDIAPNGVEVIKPELLEGKVTIGIAIDEDDDINWDDDDSSNHDDYEDMDWMDDLTEEDPQ